MYLNIFQRRPASDFSLFASHFGELCCCGSNGLLLLILTCKCIYNKPQIKSKNILMQMPPSLCVIHFAAPIITIRVKSISLSAENTSEHILLTQHDYMGLSWYCFRSVMRVMGTINLKCHADMLIHTFML